MFTHRSRRPLATLLIASAAALLAPAAAAQAIPKLQQAKFKIAVEAKQTTSWRLIPKATVSDCSPLVRFSGSGRETTTFKLTSKATGYRIGGRATFIPVVGKDGFPASADAKTTRSGQEFAEEIAGSCAGNDARRSGGGPYDCGVRTTPLTASFELLGNRLRLRFDDGFPAPLVPATYETCPVHASADVELVGITNIPSLERFTAAEAFGPSRQHILLARRTFPYRTSSVNGQTTVSWTATITRTSRIS